MGVRALGTAAKLGFILFRVYVYKCCVTVNNIILFIYISFKKNKGREKAQKTNICLEYLFVHEIVRVDDLK